MAGEPPEKSLFQIQKISAGEISKNMQRVFLAGRSTARPCQATGLSLGILLEIGSSFVVDRHQKWTKSRIVARKGGFFFGFAEQKPYVLGGKCSWGSRRLRLFGF